MKQNDSSLIKMIESGVSYPHYYVDLHKKMRKVKHYNNFLAA